MSQRNVKEELFQSWNSIGQNNATNLSGRGMHADNNSTLTEALSRLSASQLDQSALLRILQQDQNRGQNLSQSLNQNQNSSLNIPQGFMSGSQIQNSNFGDVGVSDNPELNQLASAQLRAESLRLFEQSGASLDSSQANQWHNLQNPGPSTGNHPAPSLNQVQPNAMASAPQPRQGGGKPKQRARRGQATDPHSIAERLRRERIAERMKSLTDLVPTQAKSDKASVLDDIIEYVRFLQLQVKVLNLSKLNESATESIRSLLEDLEQQAAEKGETKSEEYSTAELRHMERQVALLLETDMGSAMQYLQSKHLCLMPIGFTNQSKAESSGQGAEAEQAGGEVQGEPRQLQARQIVTAERRVSGEENDDEEEEDMDEEDEYDIDEDAVRQE